MNTVTAIFFINGREKFTVTREISHIPRVGEQISFDKKGPVTVTSVNHLYPSGLPTQIEIHAFCA